MRPSFNTVLLLAAAPAVLPALAGAATVTTYTNRATYTAAVAAAGLGPGVLETFDTDQDFVRGDNVYNGNINFRVTTDSRKTFVANRVTVFGDGQTSNGMLDGEEDSPGTRFESLAYILPTASKAFGGDFQLRDFGFGPGSGIALTVLGQTFDLRNYLADNTATSRTTGNAYSGFFGVVTDEAFTTVDPSLASSGFGDNYFLDNLTYSPASVAANPVPEPLTACGAAIGLGGLVLRRRRPLA